MKPKVIIGSANLHRAQRYAHKDPAPFLPFTEKDTTTVKNVVSSIILTVVAFCVVIATLIISQ